MQPGMKRIEVTSKIIRSDGPPIAVNYRLVYKEGVWLVYDFSVEGISMIQSFRSQFAEELSSGMSIDTLTAKLEKHNVDANR
jgi:phospholipid transport system substrate-binding protein